METDVTTLDNWYWKLRTQWEWIAGCAEFAVLWDSDEFRRWHEVQSARARESLLLIVKSVAGNNAVAGVARIFDHESGKDRICIPRFMLCLDDEATANAYCRAPDGEMHLRNARAVWASIRDTPSQLSAESQSPNPTMLLKAFRGYRDARQAHLLDKEPEKLYFADLWHLAREAGQIIESLGKASGTCMVSASSVREVWAQRHKALFEVLKSQ